MTLGLIANISGDVAHIVWELPSGEVFDSQIPLSALPVDACEGGWICTNSVSVVPCDSDEVPIGSERR